MSKRSDEFKSFSVVVVEHINNYTVPQYGDAPNDPVEAWTPSQCMLSVKRYADRVETGRRGRLETLRDMIKIAHFACLSFDKLNPTDEEITKIMCGGI